MELHWEVGKYQLEASGECPAEEYYMAFIKELPQVCTWGETEESAVSALDYAKNIYFLEAWKVKN